MNYKKTLVKSIIVTLAMFGGYLVVMGQNIRAYFGYIQRQDLYPNFVSDSGAIQTNSTYRFFNLEVYNFITSLPNAFFTILWITLGFFIWGMEQKKWQKVLAILVAGLICYLGSYLLFYPTELIAYSVINKEINPPIEYHDDYISPLFFNLLSMACLTVFLFSFHPKEKDFIFKTTIEKDFREIKQDISNLTNFIKEKSNKDDEILKYLKQLADDRIEYDSNRKK